MRPSGWPPAGRPGPVLVDIPKNVQMSPRAAINSPNGKPSHLALSTCSVKGDVEEHHSKPWSPLMEKAKKPDLLHRRRRDQLRSGSPRQLLRDLVEGDRLSLITSTLMGLGAYPASDKQFLGNARDARSPMRPIWRCMTADLMIICVGARFDDRITGRLDAFSPGLEEDRTSISTRPRFNKNVPRRCADHRRRRAMFWRIGPQASGKARGRKTDAANIKEWQVADRANGVQGRLPGLQTFQREDHQATARAEKAL